MDPAKVKADDFFFSGLHLPGNTSGPTGAIARAVTTSQIPGLNTLGLTIARLDYARDGFFAPHFHARASEIHIVLEGTVEVGFVTSSPTFRHYGKVLRKGDVFVVPIGLIHYQRNVGDGKAVAIVALNSQRAGNSVVPNFLFGASPEIPSGYLAKALLLDKRTVEELQQKF